MGHLVHLATLLHKNGKMLKIFSIKHFIANQTKRKQLTRGLMRCLTKESCNLPFSCSNITSCAKAIERFGSINESIVSVESIAFTSRIVSIFKHLVKKRRADNAGNIVCWGTWKDSTQIERREREIWKWEKKNICDEKKITMLNFFLSVKLQYI